MSILHDDNKIRVTAKVKPGQRLIRIGKGDEAVYMPVGISGGGGDSMSFYRCSTYDDGETIPAYSNLVISGLTTPTEANGTYVVNDIEAEGTDRKWSNGDYTVSNSDYTWYIHKSTVTSNKMTALYYCEVLPATKNEGTAANPKYWDSVITDTENRWVTPVYSTGDFGNSGNKCNFYVKLTAGTAYQMGVSENGNDNVVRLYDLADKVLIEDDGNSTDINGIACSDAFTFTPTVTGVYRFEAGAWSTAVGDVQAVCFPAPEVANAPTKTEPWELDWEECGYPKGAYLVSGAGYAGANGEYEPSSTTLDTNTVWTNKDTGVVIKANVSGSWRWEFYTDSSASKTLYTSAWSYDDNSPWDVAPDEWSYTSGNQPIPSFSRGLGVADGTLILTESGVAERPATGVEVWSGYKATQDADSGKWNFADDLTKKLQVKGAIPIEGRIYSSDTTVQVLGLTEANAGKMLCLAHFDGFTNDTAPSFVDGTDTCIVSVQTQSSIVTQNANAKFGNGRWGGNYRNPPSGGCFNIIGLPEIAGDFTIEFWFYYTGYSDFGGTFVYTYTGDDYYAPENVVEIKGENLAETHPQYKLNEWVHRAFVRKGTTVTEYINGVKVGTSEFAVAIGGERKISITGGGVASGSYDVRNYIDEFAIFDYAKYTKDFTPPFIPYDDEPSGLHSVDTAVRDVTVKGIKGISWANSKSYALVSSSATGTSRQWVTADGKWYICFNDMNMNWVIASTPYYYDAGYVEAAYIQYYDDQSMIEPIGHSGWRDAMGNKVKVTNS